MSFVVIYDACVLYPAPLRDFLMRLALTGLFRARWTKQIHGEWTRSVIEKRPDLEGALERTVKLMDQAVPDALITGHEPFIEQLHLPDPDDRHVLAAAIVGGAQLIITFNLRDFPETALAPYGIEAVHPDTFAVQQFDLNEARVIEAARKHRHSLRNPPKSADEYLDTLAANGLVVTADRLRTFAETL